MILRTLRRIKSSTRTGKWCRDHPHRAFKTVTLHEWWGGEGSYNDFLEQQEDKDEHIQKSKLPLPLVDLRSEASFAQRSILSSYRRMHADDMNSCFGRRDNNETRKTTSHLPTIVNLPIETLLSGERSCELPPRHVEFAILVPALSKKSNHSEQYDGEVDKGRSLIPSDERLRQDQISDFFFATTSKVTSQSRKPWLVRQVIQDCDQTWIDANQLGLIKTYNDEKRNQIGDGVPNNIMPLSRLWKPDAMVETILLPLLKQQMDETDENIDITAPKTSSVVWDLGSGAGRDVCFLAEEMKLYLHSRGYQSQAFKIVGIDNHKGSARRCLPLWKYRHVDHMTEARLMDLNNIEVLQNNILREERSHTTATVIEDTVSHGIICLYAIRFLNRKMIEHIISETCPIKKGTLFAMSYFCKPHKGASWDFDHPKESSVLDRNELRDKFISTGQWKILHDEIYHDGDHGRTLQQFIAERLH